MTRWQYAWMTDQPATTIGFSHPQPGLAVELAGVLGPGVALHASTEWSISLDRMRVNLGYVSGLLGDRGWEMFAVETRLQPGAMSPAQLQTNWYFKRPAPEVQPQPTHQQTAPAQPMQPTTPTMQPTTPTMQPTTPTMQPTSAPMQQSTPPIQSTTPPGTYSSTPSAGVPGVPTPEAGGVGFASINPPAGPKPTTPQFPPPPGLPARPTAESDPRREDRGEGFLPDWWVRRRLLLETRGVVHLQQALCAPALGDAPPR